MAENTDNRRQREEERPSFGAPGWLSRIPDCANEDFGVPLGKIRGIPTKLHFSYWLVFVLQVIIAQISNKSGKYTGIILITYGPILVLSVLAQEYCKASFAKSNNGTETEKIVLWPLGGYNYAAKDVTDPKLDMKIALIGTVVHIPVLVVTFIVLAITDLSAFGSDDLQELKDLGAGRFIAELSSQIFLLHLVIVIVNLLMPSYPLECSRFLTTYLVKERGIDTPVVALYSSIAGMIVFVPMLICGMMLKGSAIGLFLTTIGFYAFTGACKLFMLTKQSMHMNHEVFRRALYGSRSDEESPPEQPRPRSKKPRQESGDAPSRPDSPKKKQPHKKRHVYDVSPDDPFENRRPR